MSALAKPDAGEPETPREIGLRRSLTAERQRRREAEQAKADTEIEVDRLLTLAGIFLAYAQGASPQVARQSIALGLGAPETGLRDKTRGISEREFGAFLCEVSRMLNESGEVDRSPQTTAS